MILNDDFDDDNQFLLIIVITTVNDSSEILLSSMDVYQLEKCKHRIDLVWFGCLDIW